MRVTLHMKENLYQIQYACMLIFQSIHVLGAAEIGFAGLAK
jgi:hypothetical protein